MVCDSHLNRVRLCYQIAVLDQKKAVMIPEALRWGVALFPDTCIAEVLVRMGFVDAGNHRPWITHHTNDKEIGVLY